LKEIEKKKRRKAERKEEKKHGENFDEKNSKEKMAKKALVYGGNGALGAAIVSGFKSKNWVNFFKKFKSIS